MLCIIRVSSQYSKFNIEVQISMGKSQLNIGKSQVVKCMQYVWYVVHVKQNSIKFSIKSDWHSNWTRDRYSWCRSNKILYDQLLRQVAHLLWSQWESLAKILEVHVLKYNFWQFIQCLAYASWERKAYDLLLNKHNLLLKVYSKCKSNNLSNKINNIYTNCQKHLSQT